MSERDFDNALSALLPSEEAGELARKVARLPDPDSAVGTFLRLSPGARPKDSWRLHALLTIAAYSPFLGRVVLGDPGFLDVLPSGGPDRGPRAREDLEEDLARFQSIESHRDLSSVLRRFKLREYLRVALADFLGTADLSAITRALSLLADVLVDRAVRMSWSLLAARHGAPTSRNDQGQIEEARFAVIGLGKLGGEELNYSSDIDLLYLFSRDGETAGAGSDAANVITNREFFTRLAANVTRLIAGHGPEGQVFRIDLGLRPGGRDGDLVISTTAAIAYYRNWAESWERQALIKARPSAGDLDLGRRFVEAVEPLIYALDADPYLTLEIGAMKDRIDAHLSAEGRVETDIKLGRGGIREIEFAVQALQLRHGGRDPWLRQGGTLLALHRLAEKGYVTYAEYAALTRAYGFLRDLEHRLQLGEDRQTATLPVKEEELRKLARMMRLGEVVPGSEAQALAQELDLHRRVVRSFYDSVVGQAAQSGIAEEVADLWLDRMDDATLLERLRDSGLPKPESVLRPVKMIRRLLQAAAVSPDLRRALRKAGPTLLQAAARSLSPKRALNNLETFLASIAARPDGLLRFVSHREILAPTVRVLGRSDLLAGWLIRHPGLLRKLEDRGVILKTPGREAYRRSLLRAGRATGTRSARAARLRRRHQEALATIALRDINRQATLREVLKSLSNLADATIEAALDLARDDLEQPPAPRGGWPRLAVLGLGRLGYRELDYGSDLDLIFVVGDEKGNEPATRVAAGRWCESILRILTTLSRDGQLYRVDLRLRPLGREGDLVISLESLRDYFRRSAEIWEMQSFLKARAIAGDPELGRRAVEEIETVILERARVEGAPAIASAIEEMRSRLQTQSEGIESGPNVKLGEGGLLDVHFLIESLQLRHLVPNPQDKDTLRLLTHLHALGLLGRDQLESLYEGYLFLRALQHEMRLIHDPPLERLPDDRERLREIALSLDPGAEYDAAAERLIASLRSHTRAIRSVCQSLPGAR